MNEVISLAARRFPAWLQGEAVACNDGTCDANTRFWFAWPVDAAHAGVAVFGPEGGRTIEPVLAGEAAQALRHLGLNDPDAAAWSGWPKDDIDRLLTADADTLAYWRWIGGGDE